MVKTTIDINTKVKVKNIEVEEYEKIMNVWRACMLFFEREIRKMHDKEELSTETLQKVANNVDFTELLRMNFLSIKDQERMRLVKLTEVAEAIQRVQQVSNQQIIEPTPDDQSVYVTKEDFISEYSTTQELDNQEYPSILTNSLKSILNKEIPIEDNSRPEIHTKDHLKVLQRNTASSVVELRKMMYLNIQKIRQALSDETS